MRNNFIFSPFNDFFNFDFSKMLKFYENAFDSAMKRLVDCADSSSNVSESFVEVDNKNYVVTLRRSGMDLEQKYEYVCANLNVLSKIFKPLKDKDFKLSVNFKFTDSKESDDESIRFDWNGDRFEADGYYFDGTDKELKSLTNDIPEKLPECSKKKCECGGKCSCDHEEDNKEAEVPEKKYVEPKVIYDNRDIPAGECTVVTGEEKSDESPVVLTEKAKSAKLAGDLKDRLIRSENDKGELTDDFLMAFETLCQDGSSEVLKPVKRFGKLVGVKFYFEDLANKIPGVEKTGNYKEVFEKIDWTAFKKKVCENYGFPKCSVSDAKGNTDFHYKRVEIDCRF